MAQGLPPGAAGDSGVDDAYLAAQQWRVRRCVGANEIDSQIMLRLTIDRIRPSL
jgi:hypothetical protein